MTKHYGSLLLAVSIVFAGLSAVCVAAKDTIPKNYSCEEAKRVVEGGIRAHLTFHFRPLIADGTQDEKRVISVDLIPTTSECYRTKFGGSGYFKEGFTVSEMDWRINVTDSSPSYNVKSDATFVWEKINNLPNYDSWKYVGELKSTMSVSNVLLDDLLEKMGFRGQAATQGEGKLSKLFQFHFTSPATTPSSLSIFSSKQAFGEYRSVKKRDGEWYFISLSPIQLSFIQLEEQSR